MLPIEAPDAIGYVDASFTQLAAGGGYVARIGDRIVLGGHPLHGMVSSNHAEARSALRFVETVMARPVPPARIDVRTDSNGLVTLSRQRQDVILDVVPMHELCERHGTALALSHCKGHSPTGSAAGFLNHCADRLAALGASGETMAWDLPYDAFWRLRVMECHESLRCDGIGLTRLESADYLGVAPDVIDRLWRNGHIEQMPGRSLVDGHSLMRIRPMILARGLDIPPRPEPLRPARGRIDEAESGFTDTAPSRHPVQMVVHTAGAGDDVAAVISIEGPGDDEILAARFPRGDGPSWEAALDAMLALQRDRHPGCDRLVVVASDGGLVDALNGLGPWQDLPALQGLDGRLAEGGLTIEARQAPASSNAWQVAFPQALLPPLVEYGTEGAWIVEPHFDRTRRPTLRISHAEPPWSPGRRHGRSAR